MRKKDIFHILLVYFAILIALIQCQSDRQPKENDKRDTGCNLVINEINTRSPKVLKNQDFIELKMMCSNKRKSDSLQGFKVIGMSTGTD